MKFLRALFLFGCAIALLTLAGFVLVGTPLAAPVAIAGVASVALALA
jgi:hypothetical protein